MANARLGGLEQRPDFGIDTAAIQRKYDQRSEDFRRTYTGVTQVPMDCQGENLRRRLKDAGGRFIEAMEKRGWDLDGRVHIGQPHVARDNNGIPQLDKYEYALKAVFRPQRMPERVREEVPSGLVRRDPEQTISLEEARKALRR